MKMRPKDILREQALSIRRSIPPTARLNASLLIQERLIHRFAGLYSQWLVYRSLPDEVGTERIFSDANCRIYAPVTHACGNMEWMEVGADTDWKTGSLNIQEPVSNVSWRPCEGDTLIVCPLVGFDREGARLGLGLGCFDRWLAKHQNHIACKVGLAFSCQEFESIPTETHDIPLDYIVTEREIIRCPSA
jgi:5-formyltetrahydrofolate cyclo-ligase